MCFWSVSFVCVCCGCVLSVLFINCVHYQGQYCMLHSHLTSPPSIPPPLDIPPIPPQIPHPPPQPTSPPTTSNESNTSTNTAAMGAQATDMHGAWRKRRKTYYAPTRPRCPVVCCIVWRKRVFGLPSTLVLTGCLGMKQWIGHTWPSFIK